MSKNLKNEYALLYAATRDVKFRAKAENYWDFLQRARIELNGDFTGIDLVLPRISPMETIPKGALEILSGVRLSSARIYNSFFQGFDFSNSVFSFTQFHCCTFLDCNFRNASFFDAGFCRHTSFVGCDLRDADFGHAKRETTLWEDLIVNCKIDGAKNIADLLA